MDMVLISGLVFRKNISLKKMKTEYMNPRVLVVMNNLDFNSAESLT